jgi:CheY-like chemotaxis protein
MGQADDSSIMVIGNNAHFCYLMRRYIRKSMFQPIFSTLGDEALALAQREKPRAIVLEVDHPGTTSWQILRALKGHPETHNIPVVLCSWQDDARQGLQEGASACLCMPILYEDFGAALAATLTKVKNEEGN